MKLTRTLLLAPVLLGSLAGTASAQTSISVGVQINSSGRASVDRGYFYDDLAQYGNWVERPSYGWVWRPRVERSSWRPYEDGRWAWTDEGWTWISEEPYGWATYHYGRWYDDPDYGWEWIPGDEYAPAWVSWQESDDYIGWAPLPPSVSFRPGVNLSVQLAPEAYVFVQARQFLAPRISDYVVPQTRYRDFYSRTRNVTRYNRVNNRIYNQGVSVERIQRVVGRQVTRYQVGDIGADQRHRGARIERNQVTIFRPEVRNVRVTPPSQRQAARRSVVVSRGADVRVRDNRDNRVPSGQMKQQDRAQQSRQRAEVQQQRAQDQRQKAQAHQQQAQNQRQQAQAHQQRGQNQQQQAQAHRQRAQGNQQKAKAERQKARQQSRQQGRDNGRQKPPKQ
jgi:hypothetical protein